MASTRDVIAPPIFAEDASTTIPPTPIAGQSYRDPVAGPASSADGWPYAQLVNSAEFNQLMFQWSSLLSIMDLKGLLGWSNLKDYTEDAIAFGSDGKVYKWLQESGPNTTAGVKDPISEPLYWREFGEDSQDLLDTVRIDIASAANVDLNALAPSTRHINVTGSVGITGFTLAAGRCYFVRFAGAPLLTNSASLITQTGANIQAAAGDTCIIRATAANVVEILCYSRVQRFTIGSAIALSGTSIDVLSIPAWAKRITLAFDSASLSGGSSILVQLGAGSIQNTGYQSTSTAVSTTAGNVTTGLASSAGMVVHTVNPAYLLSGQMVLINTSGNRWIQSHALGGNTDTRSGGGHVALSGILDRIRFTTVNGTDTYDASGTVTITFEG